MGMERDTPYSRSKMENPDFRFLSHWFFAGLVGSGLILALSGCSRPDYFLRVISLGQGSYNPLTRTISGDAYIVSVHQYCAAGSSSECDQRNLEVKIGEHVIKTEDKFMQPNPVNTE